MGGIGKDFRLEISTLFYFVLYRVYVKDVKISNKIWLSWIILFKWFPPAEGFHDSLYTIHNTEQPAARLSSEC